MNILSDVTILDAVSLQSEALFEAALTLNDAQKRILNEGTLNGKVILRILLSDKAASPSSTVDSISGSYDGTNFRVLQSWTGVAMDDNGEIVLPQITYPLHGLSKIRLLATVSSLTGTNKITCTAKLVVIA